MTNDKSKTFPHGFTLIEILVALTIMSLLFIIGYAGFRDFARRQELERAVRQVKGDLRYAQELALSGKKPSIPPKTPQCVTLDGYYFAPESAGPVPAFDNYYSIKAVCNSRTNFYTDITKGDSLGQIYLSNPSGKIQMESDRNILFKSLGQGVEFIGGPAGGSTSEENIIIFSNDNPGLSRTVTVTSGGEIR